MSWKDDLSDIDWIDLMILENDPAPLYPVEVIMMSGAVRAGSAMFEELGPLPVARRTRFTDGI